MMYSSIYRQTYLKVFRDKIADPMWSCYFASKMLVLLLCYVDIYT